MSSLLSPLLYCRRNLARTMPMAFVIALAVTLVSSIVTIVHSIDITVYTLYGYERHLAGITPRNALRMDPAIVAKIKKVPDLGKLFPTHSYTCLVKTIFGKMPLPIFGIDREGRELIMQRSGVVLASGRMPEDDKPEAVISEDIARNLGLKIGSQLCYPDSQDSYAPIPIILVGTLKGPVWLGLTSRTLVDTISPYTMAGFLAFAPTADIKQQRRLDKQLESVIDKGRARLWQFSGLVAETRSALSNLYLILDLVVGIVVFAISFVCALLANIYFTQRLPEIATLSAIGFQRKQLLLRVCGETALLSIVGWAGGLGFTVGLLSVIKKIFLIPRGLLLEPFDMTAFKFTLPLPLIITLFALATIAIRLRTLDPVSIIERRG